MSDLPLKSTVKYPTSLIINGASRLGLEIAESLLEQGGYVVLVDLYNQQNIEHITAKLQNHALVSLLDYSAIPHLEEDIRRLDYVFYLDHEYQDLQLEVTTQDFLKHSNYLDATLALSVKFEAKFVLTTSIKAHQALMESLDVDVNYGPQASLRRTIYTSLELQRYAESLTLEYVEKASLNGRILRLGELIGSGMSLNADSVFNRLALAAVAGQPLPVPGDGLEAETYVHMLDAAYGVVRAEFSKDTVGQIYSVGYDNPITHLSVAYKIQELEPNAREISFDKKDSKPSLRLHKPAPNLSAIGWRPSVEFAQAVSESLLEAHEFIEQLSAHSEDPEGVIGKLKLFLNLADQPAMDAGSEPVSKLIEERRRQEAIARGQSLDKASDQLHHKQRRQARTLSERWQRFVWQRYLSLRSTFKFLKHVTPSQFLGYTLLAVLLVLLYINIISPVAVVLRNLFLMNEAQQQISAALNSQDFSQLSASAATLNSAVKENSRNLESIAGVARYVALGDVAQRYVQMNKQMEDLTQALDYIAFAAKPFGEYLGGFKPNVSFRPSSDSYLVAEPGLDYSSLLSQVAQRQPFIERGQLLLGRYKQQVNSGNAVALPQPLAQMTSQMTQVADSLAGLSEALTYAPEILGNKESRTYLFLLLDNSRPMPIGGAIAAYSLVTIHNGSVSEIKLQSIDSSKITLPKLDSYVIENVNATSAKGRQIQSVADLAWITDTDIFTKVAKQTWQTQSNRQIDGVVLMNFQMMADWLSTTGVVKVEQQEISGNGLLSNLQSAQTANATLARRHDVAAQAWALLWERAVQNYSQDMFQFLQLAAKSAAGQDIKVMPTDLSYSKLQVQYDLAANAAARTDMPVQVIFSSDGQLISPDKYPSSTQTIISNIKTDSSVAVTRMEVKFPAVRNVDEVAVCLPLSATNFNLLEPQFATSRFSRADDIQCVAVDVIAETELVFGWDMLPIENSSAIEYNISFGVTKSPGVEVTSSIEVNLAPGLRFARVSPQINTASGRLAFTDSLSKDLILDLFLSK